MEGEGGERATVEAKIISTLKDYLIRFVTLLLTTQR